MLKRAVQPGTHTLAERGHDLHETPEDATRAVMRAESLPLHIAELCCGRGAIVRVLEVAGHIVAASDLIDYGAGYEGGRDFLSEHSARPGCTCFLTNPPFKSIEQIAMRAIELYPLVILLARLMFMESERRTDLLEHRGLARVHVFRERLPMMHRDGWAGPKASSATPFAWFVWQRGYIGAPTLHRISCREVSR
jgi:hypothetical protein